MTVLIPIERIKEGEKFFEPLNEEDFQLLVKSIQESGILQELIVKESKGYYTLLAGFNRLGAARKAGLREVPCMVVPEKDMANAIFDTDLIRRQLTEADVKKQSKVKKDYESKATYLIPKFESIKQYLPAKALEALSKLSLEEQQKFANVIPDTIIPDEGKEKELQDKINDYERESKSNVKNKETLEALNSELEKLKEANEELRSATEKKLTALADLKNKEFIEKYELEHPSEKNQKETKEGNKKNVSPSYIAIDKESKKRIAELEKEAIKANKESEKKIAELEKDRNKFSRLVKESDDRLIPLKEKLKILKKGKEDTDALANKYSLEKKISAETLKELLSAESLLKRAEAIELQIEAISTNLNMFYNTLVGLGKDLVRVSLDSRDNLKKPFANISKSSNAFARDLEKIADFLKP
jgi:myosin heavy subunit